MAPKQRSAASAPSAPLPPLTIDSSALLTDAISFSGTHPITIGANTALHPRSKINSTEGPITIGANCIISERAQLIAPDEEGLIIGDYVLVEVNSIIQASSIGNGVSIEVGSKLGKRCKIGNNCSLSPLSIVQDDGDLADLTVIYGDNSQRQDASDSAEARNEMMLAQIACLKKLLPNKTEKYSSKSSSSAIS